jgi:hypothetical protein
MRSSHSSSGAFFSRRAALLGGLASAAWWMTACAGATSLLPAPASPLAEISIVERASGKVLPVYRHRGEYWVAGRPGANYAIRVRNNTQGRILGVISVDGLNVLTGRSAAARPDDGYVFDGGESSDIEGWRKSLDRVAAFYFSESDMSYASRTGRPQDVGVIGVALFREKTPIVYEPGDASGNGAAATADAAAPDASSSAARRAEKSAPRAAPAPAPSLGTGHGAIEVSHVSTTRFDSATQRPEQLVRIRYDSFDNLLARGVIPRPWPAPREPRAFPGDGFVPDPPSN